jgi:hypothetical protein
MIVGDSYAVGVGDWYITANKNRHPKFQSSHIIHQRTGKDVLAIGQSGTGSLGIVGVSISRFELMNATIFFKLEPPQWILVYFFEGNDLNNNLRDIIKRFDFAFDRHKIYNPNYFRRFIEKTQVTEINPLKVKHNLFVNQMVSNMLYKKNRFPLKEFNKQSVGKINKVLINSKEVKLPDKLLSPSLELTDNEIHLALYVFEQSLLYLHDYFPASRIAIVYLPAPLSSYQIVSRYVSIQTYENRDDTYSAELVRKRSDMICALVEKIALKYHFDFIDSRPVIWESSANHLLHGPVDWKHFNKQGYTVLAEAIIKHIQEEGSIHKPR